LTTEEKSGTTDKNINVLMQAIRRALLLAVSAIDTFLAASPPAEEQSTTE